MLEQHDLPKLEHKVFGHVIQDWGHFVIKGLCWQLVCHAVQNQPNHCFFFHAQILFYLFGHPRSHDTVYDWIGFQGVVVELEGVYLVFALRQTQIDLATFAQDLGLQLLFGFFLCCLLLSCFHYFFWSSYRHYVVFILITLLTTLRRRAVTIAWVAWCTVAAAATRCAIRPRPRLLFIHFLIFSLGQLLALFVYTLLFKHFSQSFLLFFCLLLLFHFILHLHELLYLHALFNLFFAFALLLDDALLFELLAFLGRHLILL